MLGLPIRTEIRKPISKELIYKNFPDMKGEKRKKFDEDISRITITNELSEKTLNLSKGQKIRTIFVIQLQLKKKDFSKKNIDIIFKIFKQNIILVLSFEDKEKVIINYVKNIESDWHNKGRFTLSLEGLDLDKIFENFVKQIGNIVVEEGKSLEEQIILNDEKAKILKRIEQIEKRVWKEKDPKKKFELVQKIDKLKIEMRE